uniref:Peptidase S54 rhomboid domain-containing protein n=1 Tax=Graphocephala atropunctata TaxID=36148 RepID=A0A1B6MA65_9HEMI
MDPRYRPVQTKSAGDRVINRLKCALPYVPCFICVVGFVQTVLFLINSPELFQLLLYSPDLRLQPWRYVSYMLLHLDTIHLLINLGIQTVLAVPLEAEQGFLRTALVYILGGLAGSLGTAVLDPELSMVGSSAGIYALLLAQLPNILYNYELLRYQWYRVVCVVCLCVGDVTYDMFRQAGPVISWAAHISGAIAGLLVGLTVFTSYSDYSPLSLSLLRYASVVLFTILLLFSILYIHTHKNKAILH